MDTTIYKARFLVLLHSLRLNQKLSFLSMIKNYKFFLMARNFTLTLVEVTRCALIRYLPIVQAVVFQIARSTIRTVTRFS